MRTDLVPGRNQALAVASEADERRPRGIALDGNGHFVIGGDVPEPDKAGLRGGNGEQSAVRAEGGRPGRSPGATASCEQVALEIRRVKKNESFATTAGQVLAVRTETDVVDLTEPGPQGSAHLPSGHVPDEDAV